MASTEIIREAALYLEYFLNGMSECSIIGSYTVQFLEMRGFSLKLQASLADHLIQLVANMKGLLLKLDSSLLSTCHTGIQTDDDLVCPMCSCPHSSVPSPHKSPTLDAIPKHRVEPPPEEKTFDAPDLVHLLTSTPLIELKQEMNCVSEVVTPCTSQTYQGVEIAVTDVDLVKQKADVKEQYERICTGGAEEDTGGGLGGPPPSLPEALGDNMELDYVDSTQGQILIDDLDESEGGVSDKLMYSVYTMNPCGSLQLVSRVVTNTTTTTTAPPPSKELTQEPPERATIKINSLKDEEEDPLAEVEMEVLALEHHHHSSGSDVRHEDLVVAQDHSALEDKQSSKLKRVSSRKMVSTDEGSGGTIITTDIVKLGPEDLGVKNYWCGVCEKEYPSAGSLKVHLSRAHSQVKWCHTCAKTVNSEAEMNDHVRECHSDLPFICVTCGQSLRTNAAFQRHMDIHKGLRGSACEICGQTFSRTEYYREHKRIHTGEKPYKCDTCNKTFTRSSNLNTHMRIHNTEDNTHTCTVCKKTFRRRDKLKDHMIRHWQIKRYACRLCPKAYSEKRDLTRHLSKIHAGRATIDADT